MAYKCETHTAYIYDRGGKRRIGILDPLTYVTWGRTLDDISSSTVRTVAPSWECAKMLAEVMPGRHEMVVFRGTERVWEGPITRLAYHSNYVEIEARDVMHYAYRTVMHAAHDNHYPNIQTVVERAREILLDELARKEALDPPINVLPYLVTMATSADARTSRKTIPFESTVFEDIDSMAQYAGLDYTVVGRRIIVVDTHTVYARTQTVTEADFIGDVVITLYGMDLATEAWVLGQEAEDGTTPVGHYGGTDPYYGEWEVLDTPYNEGGEESVTQGALDSQAQRNIAGKNPTPLMVRLPQGSTLNPAGILKIGDLVPGVRIPLRATLTARKIAQMQKLKEVRVTEEEGTGETIQVTMNPASLNDEDVEPE